MHGYVNRRRKPVSYIDLLKCDTGLSDTSELRAVICDRDVWKGNIKAARPGGRPNQPLVRYGEPASCDSILKTIEDMSCDCLGLLLSVIEPLSLKVRCRRTTISNLRKMKSGPNGDYGYTVQYTYFLRNSL